MAKKFKRHFTGHDNGKPGKGSWRRDAEVSEEEFAQNWERIFGKKQSLPPQPDVLPLPDGWLRVGPRRS